MRHYHSISDATFYNWRSKYGCIEESDGKKLKALEVKNVSLTKIFAESVMDVST
jgi:putative transposase